MNRIFHMNKWKENHESKRIAKEESRQEKQSKVKFKKGGSWNERGISLVLDLTGGAFVKLEVMFGCYAQL